jgi:hypothetical protein
MADSSGLTHQSQRETPSMVGLCPGADLGEFYMPLEPGEGHICPMCPEELVVYVCLDLVREALEQRYHPQLDKIAAELELPPADCIDQRFGVGHVR